MDDTLEEAFYRWIRQADTAALQAAVRVIQREIDIRHQTLEDRRCDLMNQLAQQWQDRPLRCILPCSICGQQCAHLGRSESSYRNHSQEDWHRCAVHWNDDMPASSSNSQS